MDKIFLNFDDIKIKNNKEIIEFINKYRNNFEIIISDNKININDGIQISDNLKYLNTNSLIKILYNSKKYNCKNLINKEFIIINNFLEIYEIIDFYNKYDYITLEKK